MSWKKTDPQHEAEKKEWRDDEIERLRTEVPTLFFTMLTMEYFNRGVAPIYFSLDNMNKVLSAFPHEEAERMRRKFRKLWRKIIAEEMRRLRQHKRKMRRAKMRPLPHSTKRSDFQIEPLKDGGDPNKLHMSNRKHLVMRYLQHKAQELVQKITQGEYNEIETIKNIGSEV